MELVFSLPYPKERIRVFYFSTFNSHGAEQGKEFRILGREF